MLNSELYAVVEINTKYIKFMIFNYKKSQVNVLFSNLVKGMFLDSGVVIDPKYVGKMISSIAKKANQQLGIEIKRVALNLISNNLRIRQGQAIIEINEANYFLTSNDINELITMSKKISLQKDEVICSTRPYKYIVNDGQPVPYPPINQKANKVRVNSLIYTIKDSIYHSHLEALKYSKLELLSLVLMPFSHIWAIASRKELNEGIILIDWNDENLQVSVFVKETLYDFLLIDYGFNYLVNDLQSVLKSSTEVALNYLRKIINLNNDFLDNKVIYSQYNNKTETYLEYSHSTLKNLAVMRIESILLQVKKHLEKVIKEHNLPVVFLGEFIQIAGFVEYIKNNNNLGDIRFYTSNLVGANEYVWSSLIGNSYYQHLLNKNSIEKVFSIDRINKEPQYQTIPKEHKKNYAHKYQS